MDEAEWKTQRDRMLSGCARAIGAGSSSEDLDTSRLTCYAVTEFSTARPLRFNPMDESSDKLLKRICA